MDFGKMLIVFGIFMIIAGVTIGFSGKFFLLGQLPGDIDRSSIVGTILLNLFFRK